MFTWLTATNFIFRKSHYSFINTYFLSATRRSKDFTKIDFNFRNLFLRCYNQHCSSQETFNNLHTRTNTFSDSSKKSGIILLSCRLAVQSYSTRILLLFADVKQKLCISLKVGSNTQRSHHRV